MMTSTVAIPIKSASPAMGNDLDSYRNRLMWGHPSPDHLSHAPASESDNHNSYIPGQSHETVGEVRPATIANARDGARPVPLPLRATVLWQDDHAPAGPERPCKHDGPA